MDIHHALFWGCAAVCAVAELLILRDVFAPAEPRVAESADAGVPAGMPRSPWGVEILWGVLPAAALAATLWAAWRALY